MNKYVRQILPFASLILLLIVLAAVVPDKFLSVNNFLNVLRRSSVNGIIAVGMTMIIISGGIDLSIGSLLAVSGMVGALVMGKMGMGMDAMLVGTLAGILTGVLCGLLNGVMITKLRLAPFIVTLGTMSIFRGVSYVMNDGQPYNVAEYSYLGNGIVAGIPISVIMFGAIAVLAFLALRYTKLGRYTYAIGSNREASFHSGINVDRNLIWIYTLTGLVTGIAAMIATSRTVSAQPTAGIGLELDIIAAVVIGGASLSGGRGTILGTVIGTMLISFLRNGCTLLGISTNLQLIVIGVIIIAAVAVDQLAQSKAKE
ncbi:MAG: ABC transporter permease [Victivallales bacterium]|jgi:ribose/xylose/arabinose/galactoside ABC-type transport system permease subunit